MGDIKQIKITTFSGGISKDKRSKNFSKFSLTKHFDALTFPHKLVPYYKTEAKETKAYKVWKMIYAPTGTSGDFRLYGYGVVSGTNRPKVVQFDLASIDGNWAAPAKGESGLATRNTNCFFYYKDYIYMWANGKVIRFHTTGVDNFDDAYQTIAFTTVVQPVHHPEGDIAYFFSDNKVHNQTNNSTDWNTEVLTLPDNLRITSGCVYGNYLAIACVTKGNYDKKSRVFLWDMDATTWNEQIDFGTGEIIHIASLDNKLIAVINQAGNWTVRRGKVLIKQAIGQTGIILNELINDHSVGVVMPDTNFIENEKLYFPMSVPLNNDLRKGIWVVDSNGRATLDFVETEVAAASSKTYQGIIKIADMWWIAHSADGSVNRTDNQSAYLSSYPAIYESLIFNGGNSDWQKDLIGITVMTEPLSSTGQVVLEYRKNEDINGGSWTTIFTEDVENSISKDANKLGYTLPEFKEIQFQITSTLGAVITGLKFKYEITKRGKLY